MRFPILLITDSMILGKLHNYIMPVLSTKTRMIIVIKNIFHMPLLGMSSEVRLAKHWVLLLFLLLLLTTVN